jgi:hypothetical protein
VNLLDSDVRTKQSQYQQAQNNYISLQKKKTFVSPSPNPPLIAEAICHGKASWEFCLPNQGLIVQATVGKTHPIKSTGIRATINSGMFATWQNRPVRVGPVPKPSFVVLGEESNFNDVTKQSYLSANNRIIVGTTIDHLLNGQFVWEVNVQAELGIRWGHFPQQLVIWYA